MYHTGTWKKNQGVFSLGNRRTVNENDGGNDDVLPSYQNFLPIQMTLIPLTFGLKNCAVCRLYYGNLPSMSIRHVSSVPTCCKHEGNGTQTNAIARDISHEGNDGTVGGPGNCREEPQRHDQHSLAQRTQHHGRQQQHPTPTVSGER